MWWGMGQPGKCVRVCVLAVAECVRSPTTCQDQEHAVVVNHSWRMPRFCVLFGEQVHQITPQFKTPSVRYAKTKNARRHVCGIKELLCLLRRKLARACCCVGHPCSTTRVGADRSSWLVGACHNVSKRASMQARVGTMWMEEAQQQAQQAQQAQVRKPHKPHKPTTTARASPRLHAGGGLRATTNATASAGAQPPIARATRDAPGVPQLAPVSPLTLRRCTECGVFNTDGTCVLSNLPSETCRARAAALAGGTFEVPVEAHATQVIPMATANRSSFVRAHCVPPAWRVKQHVVLDEAGGDVLAVQFHGPNVLGNGWVDPCLAGLVGGLPSAPMEALLDARLFQRMLAFTGWCLANGATWEADVEPKLRPCLRFLREDYDQGALRTFPSISDPSYIGTITVDSHSHFPIVLHKPTARRWWAAFPDALTGIDAVTRCVGCAFQPCPRFEVVAQLFMQWALERAFPEDTLRVLAEWKAKQEADARRREANRARKRAADQDAERYFAAVTALLEASDDEGGRPRVTPPPARRRHRKRSRAPSST